MKPVNRPSPFGLGISVGLIFWLLAASVILTFNFTTSVWTWLACTIPFWLAVVMATRVFRTIRRYQDYCLWLEEQRIAAAQERQEMSERFSEIEREFGLNEWSWLDRYDDF